MRGFQIRVKPQFTFELKLIKYLRRFQIRITPQTILDFSLICYICWNVVRVVIYRLIRMENLAYGITYFLIYALLAIYLVWSRRKLTKESVMILLGMAAYLWITCLLHPEYHALFFEEGKITLSDQIITKQIFTFTSGVSILPIICLYKRSDDFMRTVTFAYFVKALFSIMLHLTGNFETMRSSITSSDSYSMSMGYASLIPMLIMGYGFIRSTDVAQRIVYLVTAVAMLWMVLISGTRGAILCIIIFGFMYLMYGINYQFKTLAKFGILAAALLLAYLCLYSTLLYDIGTFLSNLGITSRSINALLNGEISNDNGRSGLQEKALSLIAEGGPFGTGFCSSRYHYAGAYPHNIFLEILIDMGYVGGSIFILLLAIGVIRFFVTVKDYHWRVLFIIFFSCAAGRLMVSSSFWMEPFFWQAVAIGIAAVKWQKNDDIADNRLQLSSFINKISEKYFGITMQR